MDIKNNNNARIQLLELCDDTVKQKPYDYAKNGILTKCLPKIIFKGNSILVTYIQLIDMRCIMLFKYIDKLKRFKWITWY
jgi:hypothetical protein